LRIRSASRRAGLDGIAGGSSEVERVRPDDDRHPGGAGLDQVSAAQRRETPRHHRHAGSRQQRVQSVNYNPATGDRTSDYGKSAVTPAIALVVKPTQRSSSYGNYIEGSSQGGTAPAEAVNAGETFKPDVSKQYEIGAKY
ncbi:hypothetical protein OY671_010609, partial [Metschnikowia pulcherrima]